MKKTILVLFFLIVSFAQASGLNKAQIDSILNMLRAFGADEATVARVEATLNGNQYTQSYNTQSYNTNTGQAYNSYGQEQSYSGPSTSASFCPRIYRDLKRGMRGDDVRDLQRFLKELGYYNYPEITGYYGSVTENAVKNFQSALGIVSYGTPYTTGYGAVGPATRRAISEKCSGSASSLGKIMKSFMLTPKAGTPPYMVAAVFEYKGSNCTGFTLDWGDGSTPITQYPQSSTCDDYTVKKIAKHTYIKEGDFQVTMRIARAGKQEVYTRQVHSGTPYANHFDVMPTEGDAPMLVGVSFTTPDNECVSYKLDWGDGNVDSKEASSTECQDNGIRTRSLLHSYVNPGDYTLRLYLGDGTLETLPIIEQREIHVKTSQGSSDGATLVRTGISVAPTSGKAPLVVKVNINGDYQECSSYEVDWGDGTAKQIHHATMTGDSCNSSTGTPFSKEFIHTYFIPGTYTLKARAGKGALNSLGYEYQYINVSR